MEQGASTEQPPRSSLLLLNQQKLSAATEDAGRAGTAAGAGACARVPGRACREQKPSAAAATAAQVSHVPSTEGAGGAAGAGGAPGAGGAAGAAGARCRGPCVRRAAARQRFTRSCSRRTAAAASSFFRLAWLS